jgi:hypothetical protein
MQEWSVPAFYVATSMPKNCPETAAALFIPSASFAILAFFLGE